MNPRKAVPAAGCRSAPRTVTAAVTLAAAMAALPGAMNQDGAALRQLGGGAVVGGEQVGRTMAASSSLVAEAKNPAGQSPDIGQRGPRGLRVAGVHAERRGTGTDHLQQELLAGQRGMAGGKLGGAGAGEISGAALASGRSTAGGGPRSGLVAG